MKNISFPNLRTALLMISILLVYHESAYCLGNKDSKQAPQGNSIGISSEQTSQIKKILSGYNPLKLTTEEAKAIQEKFRNAGIHAGPECDSVIRSAGFDPEKLRQLAPPPESKRTEKSEPPPLMERLKVVDEKICKPLFLTEEQKDAAREKMKAIVDNHLNGTNSTISFSDGLPSMEPTTGNLHLVSQLDTVAHDLGIGETVAGDPGARGAGDISDIAKYLDCLDGLGASGKGAHKAGETINLKEYPLLIQRAAVFMYRLTK